MENGKASRTAMAAALHRAAHQLLADGRIFSDPLAVRIVGLGEAKIREKAAGDAAMRMRAFIAMRTRLAEDALAAAVMAGTTQVVVLGAGLDTFGYRSPYGHKVKIVEVDHPATQAWKQDRLAAAGIAVPTWVKYAAVHFERETLADGLARAAFEPGQKSFFMWLGVTIYLSEEAVMETLRFIAGQPCAAQVVFDYSEPPGTLDAETRAQHDARAAKVAAIGEVWRSYFDPKTLRDRLLAMGFVGVEDWGPDRMTERFFGRRRESTPRRGGHVLRAWTG